MLLRTLVYKEILNNLLNLRFAMAYFLCAFLLVGSGAIMLADYVSEKKIADINANFFTESVNNMDNARQYLWSSKPVVRMPAVTKIFAVGGEKDPDRIANVAPEQSPYFSGDFKRNPLTNLFPAVDTVFIVGVIISLLIFVLTYDALSGEREEGTLKVLLSCPIPRDQIIVAKWLGGFVSLLLPFVTSALVITLVLLLGRVGLHFDDWLRIGAIFLACTVYIAVIFSLSMMVSVMARSSTSSILILLLVWTIGIVAIPAVATPIAYLMVKPPGVAEREVAMNRIGVVDWANFKDKQKAYARQLYGRDMKDLSAQEAADIEKNYEWIYLQSKVDSLVGEGRKESRLLQRVDGLAHAISLVSPFGCLQDACVSFANTGMQHELDLRASVEDYSQKTYAYARQAEQTEGRASEIVPANGPQYRLQAASVGDAVVHSVVDIMVLVMMGVLFFLVAYIRFLRMEAL